MLYLLIQMLFLTGITGQDNKCTCTNVNERGKYNCKFLVSRVKLGSTKI